MSQICAINKTCSNDFILNHPSDDLIQGHDNWFVLYYCFVMNRSYKDIHDYIDVSNVKLLNVTKESQPQWLFDNCLNCIESRADPQIIIMISFFSKNCEWVPNEYIPFKEPLKLFSISIEAHNDGLFLYEWSSLESAPTEVDLFSNIMDVSFADIENMVPTEVWIVSFFHIVSFSFWRRYKPNIINKTENDEMDKCPIYCRIILWWMLTVRFLLKRIEDHSAHVSRVSSSLGNQQMLCKYFMF